MSSTPVRRTLVEHAPLFALLLIPALLPIGRSAEVPLSIAALIGLAWLVRRRATLDLRLPLLLFACYWVPALISAFDAVAPAKSWTSVATDLRFLPFTIFTIFSLRGESDWPRLRLAVAAIVSLWLLDAWIQTFSGFSLGGPAEAERLTGVFGAGNLKLGPVLAVLSPFVFAAARERWGNQGLIAAFAVLLLPILLAGSRASWLSFAVVCLVFAWIQTRSLARFSAWTGAALIVALLIAGLASRDSIGFQARIERSLRALQGTYSEVDAASAGRLRIWHTALAMGNAHPVNGVGVRGFRYAYPQYAQAGDSFVDPLNHEGAAHAHQLLLELFSELGALGLLAWSLGTAIAISAWRRADAAARSRAFAPGLALIAMCFPLNTHLAFYSAWWGLLFWWLLALYIAALVPERRDAA